MKKLVQSLLMISVTFFALNIPHESFGQDTSHILYHYTGKVIRDSRWGKIALFQEALSKNLIVCGKQPIEADGKYGAKTQAALMALLSCPNFKDFALMPSDSRYATVHTALWEKLLPQTPLPTVHERAFAISLSHENTDYDQVQWNYGTSDDRSVLTWGPYGATVGHGREVQGILRKIHGNDSELLRDVFGNEFPLILNLIDERTDDGYVLLKEVFTNVQRRNAWIEKFRELGNHRQVRESYDEYARSENWLKPPLNRLYSLIPGGTSGGTEIDYAFFLDNAMHMSIKKERIERCKNAIKRKKTELARDLNPAERRQVISLNLIPSMQQEDRLGRNVVYYVDHIGVHQLSQIERDAWMKRTQRKASNCGLSDERKFNPDL